MGVFGQRISPVSNTKVLFKKETRERNEVKRSKKTRRYAVMKIATTLQYINITHLSANYFRILVGGYSRRDPTVHAGTGMDSASVEESHKLIRSRERCIHR